MRLIERYCVSSLTAGRVWLYTLLYGNSLYRLYTAFTHRPGSPVGIYSVYSVYSAYSYNTAIHAIQHTALYSLPQGAARATAPLAHTQSRTRSSRPSSAWSSPFWRLAIAVAEPAGLEFGARVRRGHAEGHLCERESGALSGMCKSSGRIVNTCIQSRIHCRCDLV